MTIKYFAVILLMATFIETAFAGQELPRCANSGGTLALIEGLQKTNRKTSAKYDGYRKILQDDTPLQLATRLAYAETLAANCPQQQAAVADLVTSVIGNRIRIRGGDVKSVVFQKDQFSSSLNIYPESRHRDFLCPKDDALWKTVLAKMRTNLENAGPSAHVPKDTVNYYLYLHSERFKAPGWKLAEVPIADEKTWECIRVFRNPGRK